MSEEHRLKAQDVFENTKFFFGKQASFAETFPEIEQVIVEVVEFGKDTLSEASIYKKDTLREYINCSNRFCYNGGFNVANILRNMIKDKQTDCETKQFCQGYEGSPKGKKRYRSCLNSFKIKIHLDYN